MPCRIIGEEHELVYLPHRINPRLQDWGHGSRGAPLPAATRGSTSLWCLLGPGDGVL